MTFENGRALVIGVGEYEEPRLQAAMPAQNGAPLATTEARAFLDALIQPTEGGYPPARATLLPTAQTTRKGILAALKQLARETGKDDTVVVYFCGHGGLGDGGDYHFGTRDARLVGARFTYRSGIRAQEFLQLLSKIRSKSLLLILDLHLQASENVKPFGKLPPLAFRRGVLALGAGRALFACARAAQVSNLDATGSRTLFGKALADALSGQAPAAGNYLGLYELAEYVHQNVYQTARKTGIQEPLLAIGKNSQAFAVCLHKVGASLVLGGEPVQSKRRNQAAFEILSPRPFKSRPVILVDGRAYHSPITRPAQMIPGSGGGTGGRGGRMPVGRKAESKSKGYRKTATPESKRGGKRIVVVHPLGANSGKKEWSPTGKELESYISGGKQLEAKIPKFGALGAGTAGGGDEISVGDVSNSTGVAIGAGATSTVHIDKQINIYSSDDGSPRSLVPATPLLSEAIRLDVASPAQVFVAQTFALGVAVRQPDSPPLQIQDLPQVSSEAGEIFRTADTEIIDYRVEIEAPDFEINKPMLSFRLKKNENSSVKYFMLKAKRAGKLPILVHAYQEQYEVASARLTLEAFIQALNP